MWCVEGGWAKRGFRAAREFIALFFCVFLCRSGVVCRCVKMWRVVSRSFCKALRAVVDGEADECVPESW